MDRRKFLGTTAAVAAATAFSPLEAASAKSQKQNNKKFKIQNLVPKPPLGWNSFDSYGVYLHQDAAMANLDAFSKKLKPHGYEYFVIDGGWYGEYKLFEGTIYPDEKHAGDVALDEYGLLEPSQTYFSNGLKPIIEKAHKLGIKIGVHMMRGIPRKAVELNTPVKGTSYTAAQIADKSSICNWCHHNYGIDVSKPGAQEYYNSAYKKLADWGVDFVKVDDLIPFPDELVMIARAIENSGREMVYSLSPGGTTNVRDLPYYRTANMVRITYDIWDRTEDFKTAFDRWREFEGMGVPGFWPDLDMIPFGNLQLMQPEELAGTDRNVRLAGHGYTRKCQLNPEEMKTFITIRALSASPLMMGGDLPTLDDYSLSLITHKGMLECNQNGHTGVLVYDKDDVEVWLTNHNTHYGKGWFGIFNRKNAGTKVKLSAEDLKLSYLPNVGISNTTFKIRDIWNETTFQLEKSGHEYKMPPNGVFFGKYESERQL